MSNIQTMEKIMDLRVKEKNEIQQAYNQAIHYFEKQASELYTLLKEKEMAQGEYQKQLSKSLKVNDMLLSHVYLENLNKRIEYLQKMVYYAREEMEKQQQKLADAHVEVKKFNKMIEYRVSENILMRKREEDILMDEISVRQYLGYEKR